MDINYEGISIKSPATIPGFFREPPGLLAIALANNPKSLLAPFEASGITPGMVGGDLILMPSY